ncbi:MAG: hypothetical protein HC908_09050 [Calothrix sp. SM1_7_51]|nr:hypothetical protein [Calothrix sp. SM1_7_51]
MVTFAAAANAQTEPSTPEDEVTPEVAPLVQPRFGVRYTTEGSGYQPFTNLDAFIPLFQNRGENVTFLQGKLFLDNDSKAGGSILLGHRFYS